MTGRRRLLAVLGSLALVLLAAAVLAAAALRPARLKAALADAVQESRQRTLRIAGELEWSLWPQASLRIGRATLSEKGSDETFAALDAARLSLALWPLLSGHVVADRIELSGLRATVIRRRDGSLNIDDLLASRDSRPWQVDIAGLRLADARLAWRDEKAGGGETLAGIDAETGAIHADTSRHAYRLESASLAARLPQATARLELAGLEGGAGGLQVHRLGLDLAAQAGPAAAQASLDAALAADFGQGTLRVARFAGRVAVSHPRLPMKQVTLPVSGRAAIDLARATAAVDLAARLDGSSISGHLEVERFSPLALGLDLDIDRLDADRYLPASSSGGGLDLSALQDSRLHGSVKIGSLKLGGVRASNVRLRLGAPAGKGLS